MNVRTHKFKFDLVNPVSEKRERREVQSKHDEIDTPVPVDDALDEVCIYCLPCFIIYSLYFINTQTLEQLRGMDSGPRC